MIVCFYVVYTFCVLPITGVIINNNKHLRSIELGSIKCNLETAKIGIFPWENMSTTIAKLPKSDFAHL